MSFWNAQSGGVIDGSEKNSHVARFPLIPDNTKATVSIKNVEHKTINGDSFYQATYKIVDGDFAGFEVRGKINCFDPDPKKRDRAVNMLMRLFNICEVKPTHSNTPTDDDFLPLKGKLLGIKIQEWEKDGKEGNWVSELHPTTGFVSETGKSMPKDLSSAFSRNEKNKQDGLEDDIPF